LFKLRTVLFLNNLMATFVSVDGECSQPARRRTILTPLEVAYPCSPVGIPESDESPLDVTIEMKSARFSTEVRPTFRGHQVNWYPAGIGKSKSPTLVSWAPCCNSDLHIEVYR